MIRQNKHTFFMFTNCRYWSRYFGIILLALFTCIVPPQDTFGQDGLGDLNDLAGQAGDGGGGAFGGGGGGGGFGGVGDGSDFVTDVSVLDGEDSVDFRNQGFVGATGTRIQELGFVGPPGESSGPPLVDGASFGGGVNDGATGGGGGGGNFRGGQQNGFGGIGQEKGFQVFRKGVRTKLTPRFASPTFNTTEISTRFNNRIRRQPYMANDGGGLFVSINERVATVTGYAQTEAQRSRFMRQLRLEPGIDRVIDMISTQ